MIMTFNTTRYMYTMSCIQKFCKQFKNNIRQKKCKTSFPSKICRLRQLLLKLYDYISFSKFDST